MCIGRARIRQLEGAFIIHSDDRTVSISPADFFALARAVLAIYEKRLL